MSKHGSYLSDNATKVYKGNKDLDTAEKELMKNLSKEPKVGVLGNPLYVPYLGEVYTFMYFGNPVSITFDGTIQKYPKTIAEILQSKLDQASNSNVSRIVGEGERLN